MTHSEDNNMLWASGRIPYAIAIKRELQALGMKEVDAIKLLNNWTGYICSAMERGRQPSAVAQDLFNWDG